MVGGITAVNPYVGQYAGYVRARAAMHGARSVEAVSRSAYGQPVQGVRGVGTVSAVSGVRVGVVSGVLAGQRIGATGAVRGASPDTPVEPVSPIRSVSADRTNGVTYAIPFLRKGMDPAELAVRMRIQYETPGAAGLPGSEKGAAKEAAGLPGSGKDTAAEITGLPGSEKSAASEAAGLPGTGIEGVQKTAEEAECQTCKERKYQDGSDDPGVSFKTPAHISPEQAASAVKGHEMEHVVRERAAAEREDRRVVSQSVTMHTAICPECGRVYISGGTTRTTTASNPDPDPNPAQAEQQIFR